MSIKLTPVDALPPSFRAKDRAVADLVRAFNESGFGKSRVEECDDLDLTHSFEQGWLKSAVARVAKKLDLPVSAVIRDGGFYLVRREGA